MAEKRPSPLSPRPLRACAPWLPALGLLAALPAQAVDYQVHGYAEQGFVLSSGNNVFGDSTSGSINYFETGLNANVRLLPNLSLATQGAVRDAGITDTGVPRLDYLLADYRALDSSHASAGLRVGRVTNPIGLFNRTRDVAFTRPGVLMPAAYDDEQGTRNILFGALGAQAYSDVYFGPHDVSLTATFDRDRSLSASENALLVNLGGLPFNTRIKRSWNAQIMDSIEAGRWQIAYSHFYGLFELTTAPAVGLFGDIDVGLDFFSLRYNAARYSLTAEYSLNPNKDNVTLGGAPYVHSRTMADAGYLQGDYRFGPQWRAFARFDTGFRNQSDRSGREYAAANPGADPASQFSYDLTEGVEWRYNSHWNLQGEFHRYYGTSTVQPLDNVGRLPNDHWSLFMLMVGYNF